LNDDLSLDENGSALSLARKPYRILCLSGGGYRGLYTAFLLETLEERAGRKLGEVFDLIAGTSIGGILAIGLAAGVPAARLRTAFEEHGEAIFRGVLHTGSRGLRLPWRGWLWRKYSGVGLARTIAHILEDSPGISTMSGLRTPVLISTVDVTNNSPRVFTQEGEDGRLALVDVAMATAAAPGFFPERRVGESNFIDGGLVANAPDMLALSRALSQGHDLSDIHALSVGTAGGAGGETPRRASGLGTLLRAKKLFQLTIAAQEKLAIASAASLLKNRYIRLNVEPSAQQMRALGLDKTGLTARETLKLLADNTMRGAEEGEQAQLRMILQST
jgi:patatin-like phospholipase/acyl hydrolase